MYWELTTICAIGVLTLAAVALLNVVYMRLHDVQKKGVRLRAAESRRWVTVFRHVRWIWCDAEMTAAKGAGIPTSMFMTVQKQIRQEKTFAFSFPSSDGLVLWQ